MAKSINKKALNAEISSTLFDDFERFEMFVGSYWKIILGAALAIVIVISGGFWIVTSQRHAAKKAAHALADASTEKELVAALAEYSSAPGAPRARFRLVKLQLDGKRYDEALASLQKLSTETSDELILSGAGLMRAYIFEMTGKNAEAAAEFERLGKDMAMPALFRDEANVNAGRMYLTLKKLSEAKQALSRIAAGKGNMNFWSLQAKTMLAGLEAGDYGKLPAAPEQK